MYTGREAKNALPMSPACSEATATPFSMFFLSCVEQAGLRGAQKVASQQSQRDGGAIAYAVSPADRMLRRKVTDILVCCFQHQK